MPFPCSHAANVIAQLTSVVVIRQVSEPLVNKTGYLNNYSVKFHSDFEGQSFYGGTQSYKDEAR